MPGNEKPPRDGPFDATAVPAVAPSAGLDSPAAGAGGGVSAISAVAGGDGAAGSVVNGSGPEIGGGSASSIGSLGTGALAGASEAGAAGGALATSGAVVAPELAGPRSGTTRMESPSSSSSLMIAAPPVPPAFGSAGATPERIVSPIRPSAPASCERAAGANARMRASAAIIAATSRPAFAFDDRIC